MLTAKRHASAPQMCVVMQRFNFRMKKTAVTNLRFFLFHSSLLKTEIICWLFWTWLGKKKPPMFPLLGMKQSSSAGGANISRTQSIRFQRLNWRRRTTLYIYIYTYVHACMYVCRASGPLNVKQFLTLKQFFTFVRTIQNVHQWNTYSPHI